MIAPRRATERRSTRHVREVCWSTFPGLDPSDLYPDGFGSLKSLEEEQLQAGSRAPRPPQGDLETLTYVREGVLTCRSPIGAALVLAGEVRRASGGHPEDPCEDRVTTSTGAHVFRLGLLPAWADLGPHHDQRRFSVAERRGRLCLVASPDARAGSLLIHLDAFVYSALLDPGQHLVHGLVGERRVWLHVVKGAVGVGELILLAGDAAGVTAERSLSFTAREPTEILLVDLSMAPAPSIEMTAGPLQFD